MITRPNTNLVESEVGMRTSLEFEQGQVVETLAKTQGEKINVGKRRDIEYNY